MTTQKSSTPDVDGPPGLLEREPAAGGDGNGAEERNPAAVERRAGNLAQHHPGIDEHEDREHQPVHAVCIIAGGAGRPCRPQNFALPSTAEMP